MNRDVYFKRLAWARKVVTQKQKERINGTTDARKLVLLKSVKGTALPEAKRTTGKNGTA